MVKGIKDRVIEQFTRNAKGYIGDNGFLRGKTWKLPLNCCNRRLMISCSMLPPVAVRQHFSFHRWFGAWWLQT